MPWKTLNRPRTIINYSHSLSVAVLKEIEDIVGGPVQEIVIPCQIDMTKPVRLQLEKLVQAAPTTVDLLVPPALSYAAAYVTARLSYAYSIDEAPVPPPIIVLRRQQQDGGSLPVWELAEIME